MRYSISVDFFPVLSLDWKKQMVQVYWILNSNPWMIHYSKICYQEMGSLLRCFCLSKNYYNSGYMAYWKGWYLSCYCCFNVDCGLHLFFGSLPALSVDIILFNGNLLDPIVFRAHICFNQVEYVSRSEKMYLYFVRLAVALLPLFDPEQQFQSHRKEELQTNLLILYLYSVIR